MHRARACAPVACVTCARSCVIRTEGGAPGGHLQDGAAVGPDVGLLGVALLHDHLARAVVVVVVVVGLKGRQTRCVGTSLGRLVHDQL